MSTIKVKRTFEILKDDGDETLFFGAKVGERFTVNEIDDVGDFWLDPKKNPCIREDFWKDMMTICILQPKEIELGYVKEIV